MMFSLATLGLASAVSAAANLPSNSQVAYTGSPVQVVSCASTAIPTAFGNAFGGSFTPEVGNVQISFVNSAPVAATDVVFAVTADGRTQTVNDAGSFSTGTTISHNFTPANAAASGLASCSVESVSFADGSSWNANG